MAFLKKIWRFMTTPYRMYKDHQRFKKRMEELRKRDPFIY